MRVHFDRKKSARLREDPRRGIGFEEARQIFDQDYYFAQRSDEPEQYIAIGWVRERMFSVIVEPRTDKDGEFYHLVTLWPSTREEQRIYAKEA